MLLFYFGLRPVLAPLSHQNRESGNLPFFNGLLGGGGCAGICQAGGSRAGLECTRFDDDADAGCPGTGSCVFDPAATGFCVNAGLLSATTCTPANEATQCPSGFCSHRSVAEACGSHGQCATTGGRCIVPEDSPELCFSPSGEDENDIEVTNGPAFFSGGFGAQKDNDYRPMGSGYADMFWGYGMRDDCDGLRRNPPVVVERVQHGNSQAGAFDQSYFFEFPPENWPSGYKGASAELPINTWYLVTGEAVSVTANLGGNSDAVKFPPNYSYILASGTQDVLANYFADISDTANNANCFQPWDRVSNWPASAGFADLTNNAACRVSPPRGNYFLYRLKVQLDANYGGSAGDCDLNLVKSDPVAGTQSVLAGPFSFPPAGESLLNGAVFVYDVLKHASVLHGNREASYGLMIDEPPAGGTTCTGQAVVLRGSLDMLRLPGDQGGVVHGHQTID